MSRFVHLHNHTDYSLLDGAAPIERYIAKAKELGMEHLAITDHGNMYGAIQFYDACKAAGINPIIGCEFYVNPEDHTQKTAISDDSRYYHLLLLAQNEVGYHNLMELNSKSFIDGFYYKPRIDDALLVKHQEGLICLSACIGGEIAQYMVHNQYPKAVERARWFASVFDNGRYYIEVQDHGIPEQKRINPLLKRLSQETGIPLVATNDIHYINRSDANAHDLLLCVGTNSKKNDENRMRFETQEFYMKSEEEMRALFSWCPEAIDTTLEIAKKCNLTIDFPGALLPDYDIPAGFNTPSEYLRHLANEGLKARYKDITPKLKERLDYELEVIISMNFQGYFLIVWDYIRWAKDHGIPVGPGRGSGAGSIVAYALAITDVDPLQYDLLFERFLNPNRKSMPDFDIDFCFERRQEVIDYVTEKYGRDRVGQIATFGTLKAKAVVKDVARVLDIPFDESNRICKMIPDDLKMTVSKALELSPELKETAEQGGVYTELFEAAQILEGLHRHISTHAAGVVIGKDTLSSYVPLYRDPKTGAITTQYTMDMLERCGLVKMDFLGLKTLTLIQRAQELIRKRVPNFDITLANEHDGATFTMLCNGDSAGVFQFESQGMQRTLREAQPDSIEDLVALNALYRPGPMANIPQFVKGKMNPKAIVYADPELEEVLKTTYGVIVYQEQVMKVAQVIAGYTLGDADDLRRIMSKKKADKLAEEKVKFVDGAQRLGRSKKHAEEIFEMLKPFAGYGFNKSHAVVYSVIAYQTAYLKANYPAEFMAANLTNEINNPDKFSEYLSYAKEMGLQIAPPSINYSDKHFNVVDGKLIYGLAGIKNVGEGIVELIIQERERNGVFTSFTDFLSRMESKAMNTKLLESLILAGAFDELEDNRATLRQNLPDLIKYVQKSKELTQFGQGSLFGDTAEEFLPPYEMLPAPDYTIQEKLESEKTLLGFYVSGHPLDEFRKLCKECVTVNIGEPTLLPKERPCQLIALVSGLKEITTKRSAERMAFLQLTDLNGTIEAVIFPKVWEACRERVKPDGIFGFKGKFDNKRDPSTVTFMIDQVLEPSQLEPSAVKEAHIAIEKQHCTQETMRQLTDLCMKCQGSCATLLHILEDGDPDEIITDPLALVRSRRQTVVKTGREFSVKYCPETLQELRANSAVVHVWFD